MTTQNPYLEKHIWTHQVQRGRDWEEVIEDRKEKFHLTEAGKEKESELRDLLSSHGFNYSLWTKFLFFGGLFIIFFTSLLLIFGNNDLYIYLGGNLSFLGFMAVIAIIGRHLGNKRQLPFLIQFQDENPEFMEAMYAINNYTTQICQEIVRLES